MITCIIYYSCGYFLINVFIIKAVKQQNIDENAHHSVPEPKVAS